MFEVSDYLEGVLQSRSRDLIYVYEFYAWDYEPFPEPESANLSYDPRHALARFAGQTISFDLDGEEVEYERTVLEGVSIQKHIGKKFDTVTIRFSNVGMREEGEEEGEFIVRRRMGQFVLNNRAQGMRLIVRMISRNAPVSGVVAASQYEHSIIRFVGRVDKPDDFNRESGTLSATQDLGTIETQAPPTLYQPTCPLIRVFKVPGFDCMGNETLSEKSIEYQAEKICDGTFATCTRLENTEFFQGIRIVQLTSSFLHKHNESFFKKVLNILPGISRKKTAVGDSIHDGTPYGSPRSLVFGRWQKNLIPLQYRDTGETIWFKMAACHGPIGDVINIRNNAPNFSQPLEIVKHLGEYGGVGSQTQDTVFPDQSFHSRLAYITGRCIGSDMIVEDPAPDLTAMIVGQSVRVAFGTVSNGKAAVSSVFAGYSAGGDGFNYWSHNPVDLTRHFITESSLLALPSSHIADRATTRTASYCLRGIKDLSNAERAIFPASEIGKAGVDYKRYRSTGVISGLSFHYNDAVNFLSPPQKPGGVYLREAVYEFDTDGSLEDGSSFLEVVPVYRPIYTCNIELNEQKKAIDILYDVLLACFRGFIRWDHLGRLVVDNERPADHSYLRSNQAAGSTSIKVRDVTDWKPFEVILGEPEPLRGKVLIGAHKLTSEVRTVTSASYSADGDEVTIDAEATGGLSVTVSGPTLTGGSSTAPSTGTVTILGTPSIGDTVTVIIDGHEISLTVEGPDTNTAIPDALIFGRRMQYAINAEPGLNEYVECGIGSAIDLELFITSKYGVLNFSPALEEDHFAEIADPVDAPTASTSAGSLVAGIYLLSYAFRNTNGNTNISPILAIELADDEQIEVDAIVLPVGADSVDWFVSVEVDSGIRLLVANNDGSAFSIDSLPPSTSVHEPKRNTTGEEILRGNRSYAHKALAYADTTRSNVLDGSFSWPEGGKQSTINQVKGTFRQAIMDFAEQPIIVNDEQHQRENGGLAKTHDLNLSAVDNYWQAAYLCNGYLAKLRDGDFFFKWGSAGEAHLDEIGDLVFASDPSGEWRNVPVRIEEVTYNPRFEVFFNSRLYSTSQFDDTVLQTEVPLPSGLIGPFEPPPDISFNEVDFPPDGLVQSTDGTAGITSIRGGAVFGASSYGQYAKVRLIVRAGVTVNEQLTIIKPDENGEAVFELLASVDGLYTVELEVCNVLNVCNTTKPTASIIIGFGTLFGIAKQGGVLITKQGGTIMEQPHA
jgi:hypothetical protein